VPHMSLAIVAKGSWLPASFSIALALSSVTAVDGVVWAWKPLAKA
jgi:hypothetical protein